MLMAVNPCAQAFAQAGSALLYISEIRLAESDNASKASAELTQNGYTVLKVDGKALDVNQNAHKDEDYSRGPKSVEIGYKTTTDRKEAITDIALMNMKGGNSTHDYDELMQTSFKTKGDYP